MAERQLAAAGPSGLRLQDVAAEAGVSHPTVLHHFGSREGLVRDVIARSLAGLHRDVAASIAASSGEPAELSSLLDSVAKALRAGSHARVLVWLALAGEKVVGDAARLDAVVDAAQALRKAKRASEGRRAPPRQDTAHVVALATLALVGLEVLGPQLLENAGLDPEEAGQARFRAWLAKLLSAHLEGAPPET